MDPADITADNYDDIRSANYFGIMSLDYDDKYLFDAMYRLDSSSLFGEDNRQILTTEYLQLIV